MDVLRDGFDGFYDLIKPGIFKMTNRNAKVAHRLFVHSLKGLDALGLAGLVLDNSANNSEGICKISNAAGFVKDAEIDPRIMRLLGFDRVVVGTVTGDYWPGNSGQTIWRFPETGSLVNREGLPGVGAERVAEILKGYEGHGVSLTINLMSTPGKNGDDVLDDLKNTMSAVRDVPYVDRFELNPSCPNTKKKSGSVDARAENIARLGDMIGVVMESVYSEQDVYVKVSPDSSKEEYDDIIETGDRFGVDGYTVSNTTRSHDSRYITEKLGEGGASGDAVWDASVRVQRYFAERVDDNVKIIGCGGISSVERMRERLAIGNCDEVQIFTPLIFEGTGLLRKLRTA